MHDPAVLRRLGASRLLRSVQRAIRELNIAPVTKAFVQTRSRFWEAHLSGFGVTDRPIQEVWNMSMEQVGVRGLLVAYMTPNAERRARMPVGELRGLPQKSTDYSQARSGTRRRCDAWADDPWSRGAYCNFAPGN